MAIKYASIINSFVSTEGSNGIMTNFVYYTVLVVHDSGRREIVEGKYHEIIHLLQYVRTPMDELIELKATVKGIREDLSAVVDEKLKYVIDSLYPIPEIQDVGETEALRRLEQAGLTPVPVYSYPAGTPANGVVRGFSRTPESFRRISVKIIHEIPPVVGLKEAEAIGMLHEAGFAVNVTRKAVTNELNGTVLSCTRESEGSLMLDLTVALTVPETTGLPVEEARRTLEEAGFETETARRTDSGPQGRVLQWMSLSERRIRLYVRTPEVFRTKSVTVKWTNMQDSTGDSYTASAEFNQKMKSPELTINLNCALGTKNKHQITAVSCKEAALNKHPSISKYEWAAGGNFQVTITYPFGRYFQELPATLSFTLDSQYGLLKKSDPISLQFTFEWDQ